MSKRHTAKELRQIIHSMLANGFTHLDGLGRQISTVELSEEDMKSEDKKELVAKVRTIIAAMAVVNDVIHPAHKIAYQLFPDDAHPFIENCIKQQQAARLSKMIREKCSCCE